MKSRRPSFFGEYPDNNRCKNAQKQPADRERRFYLTVTITAYLGWFLTYEVVGHCASTLPARDFTTLFDQSIPLIPEFIWFYLSCYLLPVFFFIARTDWHRFNRMLLSFVIANLSGFLVYLIFPVTFSRPHLGQSLCERLLSIQYHLDFQPVSNNMPSMHVTFAWLIYLTSRGQQMNRLMHFAILLLAGMITVSTLFVKQHLIVDVVAGLLWAFWAWSVAKYLYPLLTDPGTEAAAALRQMARNLLPFFFSYAASIVLVIGFCSLD